MPITVFYNNDSEHPCTIRPTPLISVNSNILKNGAGEAFGVTYSITLNGKLIANEGTPYAFKTNDANSLFKFYADPSPVDIDSTKSHDRPGSQQVDHKAALGAIFSKQKSLRALFAIDGQRVEISDWAGLDLTALEKQLNPTMIFYPRITNISFAEGLYVDTCDYTITMEADVLLANTDNSTDQSNFTVDADATLLMATSGIYNISGIYGREYLEHGTNDKKFRTTDFYRFTF